LVKRNQKMIKINQNPVEHNLPLWTGKLSTDIKASEILEQTQWEEIAPHKYMLTEPTGESQDAILNLLDYFTSENILDDISLEDLADEILKEWPLEQFTDPAFLKKILNCSVTIVKDEIGREESPFNDNRLTFGKIIVNLTDYLLTPPMQFTSNMDWPATDVIYEHDFEYLDALFFLNSNKFYYGLQNNSKRDAYFLVCDLTLEPLFLVDNNS